MSSRARAFLVGLFVFGVGATAPGPFSAGLMEAEVEARARAQSQVAVAGSVVDAALKPVAGVVVTLERDGRVVAKATSDAAGAFKFAGIAPGRYRVRAEAAGHAAIARDLVVPAGVTAIRLPLVLAPLVRAEAARSAADSAQAAATRPGVAGGVAATPPPPPPPPAAYPVGNAAGGAGGRGGGQAASFGSERLVPAYPWPGGETYSQFEPNRFHSTLDRPLSTFGADVDTASYSNIRRFLASGQLPPREAVRLEELVNYFRFNYDQPRNGQAIAMTTEVGDSPWSPGNKLVLIGVRAAAPVVREITGRNITLLIDVSGSMAPAERLPMIKTALGLFVDTLRADDTLAIVTYAGTSGVALAPTQVRHRSTIQHAIASLTAGGSTNGGSGLILAYRIAREAYIPGGVNRVILATDGDFNVGITSQRDLLNLIEHERESGVFLSVMGVGSGNLKDATMEMLADRGNGNYSYLDSLQEARRVLIREGDSTLETVAKDVKFQVEFNPAMVSAWKLLGYENRALAARDFNNDRKDAGDMGAGHTVTVLYEIVPAGNRPVELRDGDRPDVDPLKYQSQAPVQRPVVRPEPIATGEWLTVKARYKMPESDTSTLISQSVRTGGRTQFLPMASAVAEFALILRDGPRQDERWNALSNRLTRIAAPPAISAEWHEFRELVATARGLGRIR